MTRIRRHPLIAAISAICVIAFAVVGYLVEEVESYPHLVDQ